MAFTTLKNKLDTNIIKYQFTKPNGSKLTYAEFIQLLKNKDRGFLREFDRQLSQTPAELSLQPTAYFGECIPTSSETTNREFEFVVVGSPMLDNITCNYSSFREHFNRSNNNNVVSFASLSGDTLVVPMPVRGHQYDCNDYDNELRDYKNLREFNSNASMEQKENFWQKVGEKMEEKLLEANGSPRWLSTSGLGVSYLHVRIDSRPKYYSFNEYRHFQAQVQQTNIQQQTGQQGFAGIPGWGRKG